MTVHHLQSGPNTKPTAGQRVLPQSVSSCHYWGTWDVWQNVAFVLDHHAPSRQKPIQSHTVYSRESRLQSLASKTKRLENWNQWMAFLRQNKNLPAARRLESCHFMKTNMHQFPMTFIFFRLGDGGGGVLLYLSFLWQQMLLDNWQFSTAVF